MKALKASEHAVVFWLSFFKDKLGCCGDEFFDAVR